MVYKIRLDGQAVMRFEADGGVTHLPFNAPDYLDFVAKGGIVQPADIVAAPVVQPTVADVLNLLKSKNVIAQADIDGVVASKGKGP